MDSVLDILQAAQLAPFKVTETEWACATCPICGEGQDRLRISTDKPDGGLAWCRQCQNSWNRISLAKQLNGNGNGSTGGKPEKTLIEKWESYRPIQAHEYLTAKGVKVYGEIKANYHGGLCIPIRDHADTLIAIQYIFRPSPGEDFKKIRKGKGLGWMTLGAPQENSQPILFAEGYATAASLHEATGYPAIVCFSDTGFSKIVAHFRSQYPDRRLVVCGDRGNGEYRAMKAAYENGADAAIPPADLLPDAAGNDFNDLHQFSGLEAVRQAIESAPQIETEPEAPVSYRPSRKNVEETLAGAIHRLNERHFVTRIGGKTVVATKIINGVGNPDIVFESFESFHNFYANQTAIYRDEDGKKKEVKISPVWVSSPDRRTYDQIVFAPGEGKEVVLPNGGLAYNLFRGFAVAPQKGDWSLFENHLFENICCRDMQLFDWLMAWLAKLVQDPGGLTTGTAPVFRGAKGTGKGTAVNIIGRLFGMHFIPIHSQRQLTGNFNAHYKAALLVFADESFWAGDKSSDGALKSLITEPTRLLEHKNVDPFVVRNYVRLIIASNETWVVPATAGERRYQMFDISPVERPKAYWDAIHRQMANGGLEAMLYDLLKLDLSTLPDPGKIIRNLALSEQAVENFDIVEKFWYQQLCEEQVMELKNDNIRWEQWMTSKEIYSMFRNHCDYINIKKQLPIKDVFLKQLRKLCNGIISTRQGGERGWRMPTLKEARGEFEGYMGVKGMFNNQDRDGKDGEG